MKPLKRFCPGLRVGLACYYRGCKDARVTAVLDREITREIHPSFLAFGGVGRVRWNPKKPMRAFRLENDIRCPHCHTTFRDALIFSRGRCLRPLIIGYEPEPI